MNNEFADIQALRRELHALAEEVTESSEALPALMAAARRETAGATPNRSGSRWWITAAAAAVTVALAATALVNGAMQRNSAPPATPPTSVTVPPDAKTTPADLIPTPGASADYGVGQIIGVRYGNDVADKAAVEKTLTITTTPAQPGSWYWINNREAHYRAKNYWQPGTTIKLTANGVSATYKIHDSWVAKADGVTHQMQVFHNGQQVKTMDLSMGRSQSPTHLGPHVVGDKEQTIRMDSCSWGLCPPDPNAYDVTGNWAVRISSGGEFVMANKQPVGQLGRQNVTNGVIDLNTADAKWFFDAFAAGDVVEVTNSGGPQLKINDGFGDWTVAWGSWQAGTG